MNAKNQPRATVVTLVEQSLEGSIAEATRTCCSIVHTRSIQEAIAATRERDVRALLISPNALAAERMRSVATLIGKCSGVMTLAVLKERRPIADQRLLELGGCGVRQVIDLSVREGWGSLREVVSTAIESTCQRILEPTLASLETTSTESRHFVELLIRVAPAITSVRALARQIDVNERSLTSRFFRQHLPSPKRYLACVRLLYACAYAESGRASLADVANRLGYSSPQSFGRHVRRTMGMSASEWRYRFSMERMITHFIDTLIVPYRESLRSFDPVGEESVSVRDHDRKALPSV